MFVDRFQNAANFTGEKSEKAGYPLEPQIEDKHAGIILAGIMMLFLAVLILDFLL
jgi:hypothetical protein